MGHPYKLHCPPYPGTTSVGEGKANVLGRAKTLGLIKFWVGLFNFVLHAKRQFVHREKEFLILFFKSKENQTEQLQRR